MKGFYGVNLEGLLAEAKQLGTNEHVQRTFPEMPEEVVNELVEGKLEYYWDGANLTICDTVEDRNVEY